LPGGLTLPTFLRTTSLATAAGGFRKPPHTQITAHPPAKEVTECVHWPEQDLRDGAFKALHMGKKSRPADGLSAPLSWPRGATRQPECKESWLWRTKVEFRVPGSGLPPFAGVLKKQELRS
jgi:hypothetical protein